jgi:DNA-binding NarL/FixJ family response regulator
MILFIDDEARYTDGYREELELELPDYDVVFHSEADSGLLFFQEHANKVELLILDIMMPPSKSFEGLDTMLGLRTGLRLYEKVREARPELPVIISTNVVDPEVTDYFSKERKCIFLRKDYYFPAEFVEVVKKVLRLR